VARGGQGEVCFRGYHVMRVYFGDPEATREAIDEAGWLHSGDLGVMDEDGCLTITGRLKDMIIRGGENVYPAEIEAALYRHPDVVEAAVFGVSDAIVGEEVAAWVKLRAGGGRGRRRRRGVRAGAPGAFQGAPPLVDRRRVPHDRHGQGPEVPAARGLRGVARRGSGGRDDPGQSLGRARSVDAAVTPDRPRT